MNVLFLIKFSFRGFINFIDFLYFLLMQGRTIKCGEFFYDFERKFYVKYILGLSELSLITLVYLFFITTEQD